jgi:hypothetical protein
MLSRLNTTAVLRLNMRLSSVVSIEARDFGAKKKKVKKTEEEPTDYETIDEPAQAQPVAAVHDSKEPWKKTEEEPTDYETIDEPAQAQPVAAVHDSKEPWKIQTQTIDLDKSLFKPYSLGDVTKVDSTPDNKAPSYEDTIEGRYANVLFTTASQKGALYDVYEDMMYLSELYTHSEIFR